MLEGVFGPANVYRGCEIPPDLWYDVERDVWLRPHDDGEVTLGMTDPAQTRAGKFLHVLFKRVGRHLDAGQSAATVESAKWAGPVPTPIAGTVVATNEAAFTSDVLVANRDPYGSGWLVRLRPDAWPRPDAGLVTGPEAVSRYEARIEQLGVSCMRCAD